MPENDQFENENSSSESHDYFYLHPLRSVQGREAWYYNLKFLGRGGNGTAFLVSCSSGSLYGMQVVLKVFHRISDSIRRQAFLREIAYLRDLRHPAIIDIYDEGEFHVGDRIYPFAVVEYVPSTARQLIASHQLDRLRAIRITGNCLSALQYMSNLRQPVIHRDLKPENILISPVTAKLADFGLAKAAAVADEDAHDSSGGDSSQWPGMPYRYRTPELVSRARGEGTEISTLSDIYQLGTVFYELLTGFNPQREPANNLEDIVLDVREIPGFEGTTLTPLIRDMLQEDPGHRPMALECLNQLNGIHRRMCEAVRDVMGQPA